MQIVFTCSGAAAQHKYHTILEFLILYVVLSCAMLLLNISVHVFSYNLLRFINFLTPQLMGSATTYWGSSILLHLSSWVPLQPIEVHQFYYTSAHAPLQPIEVHQFLYTSAHGFGYNLLRFINFITPQLMGSATTY